MKSREEYLANIYSKRDAKIKERKKRISILTGFLFLGICFASVFTFVPKYFETETSLSVNKNNSSEKHILTHSDTTSETQADNAELFTFYETFPLIYYQNHGQITNDVGNRNMNDSEIKATIKNEHAISDNKLQTEIALESPAETTTRRMNFGYAGGTALSPADPPEDYASGVSEPYSKSPDSVDSQDEIKSTSAAKIKTSEEAITEAKTFVPEEDAPKIIDEKTHVTVTRTASGKTTYTVYFYTNYKSFAIELDAVTLDKIECKEKNLITGDDSYYSPPHFPETTAALPAYVPQ